jgi:alpha-amylase/alpha-mannosidase (GH57 family)
MWLPETAVDIETLEVLADAGLRFTILAPHQARRVRFEGQDWREVSAETLDTTQAYEQRLPSGRTIALFFYHGPVAHALAFGNLLDDGKDFADRLAEIVPPGAQRPGLAHVATDGETYGHHRKFGEMALATALDRLDHDPDITLTNYSEFLARHPPEAQVEIAPDTSWSCVHGIERWRADCGCGSETQQSWRAPLREALDWLRDRLAVLYEERAGLLLRDPWEARSAYIDVLLDDSDATREQFLDRHARDSPNANRWNEIRTLLEMQHNAMLMYTSCGWFFDDLARLETIQIIRYAGRAVELAREVSSDDLQPEFLKRLEAARSNREDAGNGRDLYERHVP